MADVIVSNDVDTMLKCANKAAIRTAVDVGAKTAIDVHTFATGGAGTEADPWTGWDTAITWAEFTRYNFRNGYYSYDTSPNFALYGIELIGEPGTYLVHDPTTNVDAFVMDAGAPLSNQWIMNVRVENITIVGKTRVLTGTLSVSLSGTAVTGTGTAFTTELVVGASITFAYGANTAQSYVVTDIASDTSLTIDRAASAAQSVAGATGCLTRNGFYLRGIRNGVFDRLSVKDVSKAAIWTEACVTNSLRMFRCTFHEPEQNIQFQCRPQYGIVFSGRGDDWSTTWHVEEPVIEGVQIYGIWLKSDTYGNTFLNGTSEGHPGIGMQVDGRDNTIIGIDLEQNTGNDLVVTGIANNFIGCFVQGPTLVSGSHNYFMSGEYVNVTIDSAGYLNRWYGAIVSGTYSDSGNTTIYTAVSGTNLRSKAGIPQTLGTSSSPGSVGANANSTNRIQVNLSADATINAPTNSTNGDILQYVFNNNSGTSKGITWNAIFRSLTGATLPTTCANNTTLYVTVHYSAYFDKWDCTAVAGG